MANWAGEDGTSVTVHSLKRKLRSLKDAPDDIRRYCFSEDDVNEMLDEMLADGTAELNAEKGLVWL